MRPRKNLAELAVSFAETADLRAHVSDTRSLLVGRAWLDDARRRSRRHVHESGAFDPRDYATVKLSARVGSRIRDRVGVNLFRRPVREDHLKDHVATPVERFTVPRLRRVHDSKRESYRTTRTPIRRAIHVPANRLTLAIKIKKRKLRQGRRSFAVKAVEMEFTGREREQSRCPNRCPIRSRCHIGQPT
jgi:hypothetical protein